MDNSNNNAAKYAFFYMLSLVALIFMALSTGMIIFQLINKNIIDILSEFRGRFSSELLKFAISALIISAPIFYVTSRQIYKSLFLGKLDKDSGIRKWLTYFILFVSSVVMIGWLIGTINSFLGGELTTKFLLKAITAIGIAAAIFSFYFHDIRREEVRDKKDKVIRIYLFGSLIVITVAFIGSLFIVESPTETRNRKLDYAIIEDFNQIDGAITTYYSENNKLPESLEILIDEFSYITDKELQDPVSNALYTYRVSGEKEYELCATFRTSNQEEDMEFRYVDKRWLHEAGEQCLGQKVHEIDSRAKELIRPIPVD